MKPLYNYRLNRLLDKKALASILFDDANREEDNRLFMHYGWGWEVSRDTSGRRNAVKQTKRDHATIIDYVKYTLPKVLPDTP